MDVVYILGSGSLAEDEEIRYSVRSLCKNMLDLRNVYVVGDKPVPLPGVHHIEMRDATKEKHVNAYHKVMRACAEPDISDEFLLMNDDFFMLDSFMGAEFPFYALKGSNGGSCGPHSYHVHCPMRLKKEMYTLMPFDPISKACRSPRTFYANFYGAPPTFVEDFILRAAKDCRPFDEQVKGRLSFSIGDSAMLYAPFREWLTALFPMPSQFETV